MNNTMNIKAPAKINLTLDVIGRRQDGYHYLKMVMQTINVYDSLSVSALPDAGFCAPVRISMETQFPIQVPLEENLVYKAVMLMKEKYNLSKDFEIYLTKNIPAAAGLAGGSSDCAATLIAINQLCNIGLTEEELCETGVSLGADVPYCIKKGTVLAEGIGEILTPLEPLPKIWLVLIKPNISVSTAYVYKQLDNIGISYHPDTDKMTRAIERGDIACIASCLCNVLETVTIPKYPVIKDIKTFLKNNGAIGTLMSGSGPTVFGIFEDESSACHAFQKAEDIKKTAAQYASYDIILCHTCNNF